MICVLMSTYNGAAYLKEQIDSLLHQKDVSFQILIRDDGSTDGTKDILESYVCDKLSWYQGTNLGPGFSFLDLLQHAPEADYYAFCDQDDVWDSNKLFMAWQLLESENKNKPLMYYSNVNVVDHDLQYIETSNILVEHNNLKHVLMSSSAIGCTIVINTVLKDMINAYHPTEISMHDWWTHKLCLVMGGKVVFDKNAYISYRQHAGNVIGFQEKKRSLWDKLFVKPDCMVSKTAKELLKGYGEQMDFDTKKIVSIPAMYQKDLRCKLEFINDNSFFKETGIALLKEKIAVIRNRK
ncbi:MAG: glycosyltransferase family 2 protein [Lachnospiraceae bacterium]